MTHGEYQSLKNKIVLLKCLVFDLHQKLLRLSENDPALIDRILSVLGEAPDCDDEDEPKARLPAGARLFSFNPQTPNPPRRVDRCRAI